MAFKLQLPVPDVIKIMHMSHEYSDDHGVECVGDDITYMHALFDQYANGDDSRHCYSDTHQTETSFWPNIGYVLSVLAVVSKRGFKTASAVATLLMDVYIIACPCFAHSSPNPTIVTNSRYRISEILRQIDFN